MISISKLDLKKPQRLIAFVFATMFINSGGVPIQKNTKQLRHPNIILIVADDLGYSDLHSYGNNYILTPNIDNLGSGGVRFTQAYVTSPICSPSRMGLMTGRYQNRFGGEYMPYDKFGPTFLKNLRRHYFSERRKVPGLKTLKPHFGLNRSKYETGLDLHEIILAQLMKTQNYSTGLVGKWNIGDSTGNHPFERGYDYCYYFDGALTRYVDDPVDTGRYINKHLPWSFSELPAWIPRTASTAIREGKTEVKDTGYLTFSIAQKGIQFMEENKDHPFFLTLTFNAPHDPFQVPKNYFDRIPDVKDSVKRVYYGMIEALDDAVGSIVDKLKQLHLDDNTMIIFLSDNGGATYTRATDNAPLRGGKCTHFEGGLRVPFFIKYPSAVTSSQVFRNPVSSLDIFATVAALTNAPLPSDRVYDGVNLLPFMIKGEGYPHSVFYWRSGYSKAICKENWKLYINEKNKKKFLFNLHTDIEEKIDLSSGMPQKVSELSQDLDNWEKTQTVKPSWPSAADLLIDVGGEEYFFPS